MPWSHLTVIVVFSLAILINIVIGITLSRSILDPLKKIKNGAENLSASNLSYRLNIARNDELGDLADVFNAMTEKLEKNKAELENLSTHDSLTGVYNRHEFFRRLHEEMNRTARYGNPFTVMLIDADQFKAVNDRYGHQAVGVILRSIAGFIKSQVRPTDHVARYGGDEFTVILAETTKEKALPLAERIRQFAKSQSIPVAGAELINITLSVGVAGYPEDAGTEEKITTAADRAMYLAKQRGDDSTCFVEETAGF